MKGKQGLEKSRMHGREEAGGGGSMLGARGSRAETGKGGRSYKVMLKNVGLIPNTGLYMARS